MKTLVEDPWKGTYLHDDGILRKKFTNAWGADHLTDEWAIHYQRHQEKYGITPELVDFEPHKLIAYKWIDGYHMQGRLPRRATLEFMCRAMHTFAEYSMEHKVDMYHCDFGGQNFIVDKSGKHWLIDVDSIYIDSMLQMNNAFIKMLQYQSKYALQPMERF